MRAGIAQLERVTWRRNISFEQFPKLPEGFNIWSHIRTAALAMEAALFAAPAGNFHFSTADLTAAPLTRRIWSVRLEVFADGR